MGREEVRQREVDRKHKQHMRETLQKQMDERKKESNSKMDPVEIKLNRKLVDESAKLI